MNERAVKVLYLTSSMGLGGADKQISLVATGLKGGPVETRIICLRPLGPMGRDVRESGIDIESLTIERKAELAYKFPWLLRSIHDYDPDVIHGHMYHANFLARLFAPLVGAKSISTVHSTHETRDQSLPDITMRERLYRYSDRLSDLTTFVSDASRRRYIDIGAVDPEKATTVYNGIDLEEFQSDPGHRTRIRNERGATDEFVWLAVGRFVQAKDYPMMIEAFSKIRRDNVKLWIIGHGRLKDEIGELIERKGLEETITLLGTTEDVNAYMSAADGFVSSSYWEGFGIVIAEAMACELPVVATACGGPEEIVIDNETGYLCDVQAPDELAESLVRVLEMSSEERTRMGKRGRKRIQQKFDIHRIRNEWEAIYSAIV